MEVHANHIHKAPGKKIWHYFFEFFMLFLAVFCGFLAENYREHKLEHQREVRYIKNLYEDLVADTAIYSTYTKNTQEILSIVDSMMLLMKSPDRNAHLSRIYFLARITTIREPIVSPIDRTFDEMKSSGLLRLVNNRQVSDSISSYYNSLKNIMMQNDFIYQRLGDYMNAAGKIFDAGVLFKILKERTEPASFHGRLLSEDPVAINQFLTSAQYLYGSRFLQGKWCQERAERATNLIKLIQKEYHFE